MLGVLIGRKDPVNLRPELVLKWKFVLTLLSFLGVWQGLLDFFSFASCFAPTFFASDMTHALLRVG